MLILKLQTGGLLLDLAGHPVTFTKIECASNYILFWDHVSQYLTNYRWSIDQVLVDAWFDIGRYINRVSTNIWYSPILHPYFTNSLPVLHLVY